MRFEHEDDYSPKEENREMELENNRANGKQDNVVS